MISRSKSGNHSLYPPRLGNSCSSVTFSCSLPADAEDPWVPLAVTPTQATPVACAPSLAVEGCSDLSGDLKLGITGVFATSGIQVGGTLSLVGLPSAAASGSEPLTVENGSFNPGPGGRSRFNFAMMLARREPNEPFIP